MQKELRSVRFFCSIGNPEGTFYETKGTVCRRCVLFLYPNYNGIFTGNQESLYNLYTKNTIMDLKKGRVKTGREGYV